MTFSERAVEAAAKALRAERGLYGKPNPGSLRQAQAALTAALAVDGLALVPKEPTLEMGEAAIASLGKDDDRHAAQVVCDVWSAMLTAASDGKMKPFPPQEQR